MSRTRRVALAAALICASASAPARGAVAVAIQDDQISNGHEAATVQLRADRLAGTGTKLTRINVDWSLIAPTRPTDPANPNDPAYDWRTTDLPIAAMQSRGIAVMAVMYGTPVWASASGKWNATPRAADAAQFAATVARRYNGSWPAPGGGLLPKIKSLSPANEPNLSFWITPQCRRLANGRWVPASPRYYANLMRQAYPLIKAVHPEVIVVGGETLAGENPRGCRDASTTVGSLSFIDLVHAAFGRSRSVPFDAWAVHLHPVGPPHLTNLFPAWRTLPRIITAVNKMHPNGKMPILVTETSYATGYSAYHRYFVSEAQQARWVDLTYTLAERRPQVEVVVWFNLQDNFEWPAGLYRDDWSEKPSLQAFRLRATSTPPPAKWALP